MFLGGCKTPTPNIVFEERNFTSSVKYTVLQAELASQKYVGLPHCPDDYICINGVYLIELKKINYISGQEFGKKPIEILLAKHGRIPDIRTIFLIAMADNGELWVRSYDIPDDEGLFCFNSFFDGKYELTHLKKVKTPSEYTNPERYSCYVNHE